MSRSCNAVDLAELFGSGVCYGPSSFDHPHPAIMNDVRVFSPCARKCLIFKDLVIPLGEKIQIVLGSDAATCDLVLLGKSINAHHASIRYHDGCYFVQDLGSRCGTYVNGRRISGITELRIGDEIALRPYTIRFAGAAADL